MTQWLVRQQERRLATFPRFQQQQHQLQQLSKLQTNTDKTISAIQTGITSRTSFVINLSLFHVYTLLRESLRHPLIMDIFVPFIQFGK